MSNRQTTQSHLARPTVVDGDKNKAFAARVRQLRQDCCLTLQQLGQRSGLAASTISKVENGQMSPTYENILRFAEGLGVDVAELFRAPLAAAPSGRRSITRAGSGPSVASPHYDYEMLASDLTNKAFIPIATTIRARDVLEFATLSRHPGEEFIYILSGEVILHSEHYEPVRLAQGDSCYFASTMGHALVNGTDEDARILWVCSQVVEPLRRAAAEPA